MILRTLRMILEAVVLLAFFAAAGLAVIVLTPVS